MGVKTRLLRVTVRVEEEYSTVDRDRLVYGSLPIQWQVGDRLRMVHWGFNPANPTKK